MLAVAFVMWWLTQLSKEYSGVELPVEVRVEDNIFDLKCTARGSGFRLMSHRMFKNLSIDVPFVQLEVHPVPEHEHKGIVEPESLRRAVSARVHDVFIENVGAAPEITLAGR